MKLSNELTKKLLNGMFSKQNFIQTIFNWCIDSRYREYKRLDKWISDQIYMPSDEFIKFQVKFHTAKHNYDDVIVDILKYVTENIKYQTDSNNFGYTERWENVGETIKRGKGDCENINALIYLLAIAEGIPSYLLYNVIGTTTAGHYWLLYLSPGRANFFSIDGAYKPDKRYITYRTPFKIGKDYKKIDYIFNDTGIWKPR